MFELVAGLLSDRDGAERAARRVLISVLVYGLASLVGLAAMGFLIASLYETFLRMTDQVTAPLLVAGTLATAAILVVLVYRGAQMARSRREQPVRPPVQNSDDGGLLLVGELSTAIERKAMAPLVAVGLAVAAGFAQGARK